MSRKHPEYWKSPAILWFLKQTSKVDPEEAVKAEANRLLVTAGLTHPPFEPRKIAPYCRITSIRQADISATSQLMPVPGGFVIAIKRTDSHGPQGLGRDIFSIAHEIGHTLFYNVEPNTPTRFQRDIGSTAEERLCDIFAAELLMPQHRFSSDAHTTFEKTNSWCETLFRLRSLYKVSMRAVAERIVELEIIKEAVVIKWRWKTKAKKDSDERLRVDWSVPLREGKYYFVWPDKPAPDDSVFMRASAEGALIREVADLNLGTLKGDFLIEAKAHEARNANSIDAARYNPQSVLSVVWLQAQTSR